MGIVDADAEDQTRVWTVIGDVRDDIQSDSKLRTRAWMNRQTSRCLTMRIVLVEVVGKPSAYEKELQSAQNQRKSTEKRDR